MAGTSPSIINVTLETFENDVLQQSAERPVVIDFWAPWCGPCRQLAPLLEKLANEYAGRFVLAKVNVDEAPEIAQAFGVQSIPLVVAVSGGQPADHFTGILPEQELRQWLDRLVPAAGKSEADELEALEAENPDEAVRRYRELVEESPDDDSLKIRLARVLLAQHRDEECGRIISELESRGFLEPEAVPIRAELDLRAAAAEAGDVAEARRAAEANPSDLNQQLRLAEALAVASRHEEALQICLKIVEQDKAGVGVQARDAMVKMFEVLGPTSELVSIYRRRLSTLLY